MAKVKLAESISIKSQGGRVAERRTQLGLSQRELADLCGVHTMTVSKWETGATTPGRHLTALANALQVEPAWIVFGIDEKSVSELSKDANADKENRDLNDPRLQKIMGWLIMTGGYKKDDRGRWVRRAEFDPEIQKHISKLGFEVRLKPFKK